MRLLYVQPAEAFGGAERQGVLHIRRLPEHGIDVIPVVGPGQPILRELERAGVPDHVYCPVFPRTTHGRMGVFGNAAFALGTVRNFVRSVRFIARAARQHRADMMFASRSFGWAAVAAASVLTGIPYVARAGSRITSSASRFGVRVIRTLLATPRAFISNCHAVMADFAPLVSCPNHVVPNGIDTQRFRPDQDGRFRALVDEHTAIVGLAARPAPEKGLDFLAQVVMETVKRAPNMVVLIAGEFGWRAHFEDMFQRHGVGQHVRFLGHVQDIEQFYASCDVVILTSRTRSIEGLPNALMEAMASGKPVVATAVGGVPDLVEDGEQGFLVPDGSVADFSDRLVTLLQSHDLRLRMGQAGRAQIVERFSESRVVDLLARVLKQSAPALQAAGQQRDGTGQELA